MLPFDTAVLVHVISAGSGTPARRRPHGKVFPNVGLPKGRQAPIGGECATEAERILRQVALSHEFTRHGHRACRSLGGGRPGGDEPMDSVGLDGKDARGGCMQRRCMLTCHVYQQILLLDTHGAHFAARDSGSSVAPGKPALKSSSRLKENGETKTEPAL